MLLQKAIDAMIATTPTSIVDASCSAPAIGGRLRQKIFPEPQLLDACYWIVEVEMGPKAQIIWFWEPVSRGWSLTSPVLTGRSNTAMKVAVV
ncbi:hypothetical protein FGO68_gene15048 [Halteria grandinella]|uniref:Uncharacterized protein n=1 Tax=Halteria grandinella TaxID=5974 RepID=A0A8J8NK48_HALGN|nr:hypothetical protein FGO68_gene15048 [Halteria grandinella]